VELVDEGCAVGFYVGVRDGWVAWGEVVFFFVGDGDAFHCWDGVRYLGCFASFLLKPFGIEGDGHFWEKGGASRQGETYLSSISCTSETPHRGRNAYNYTSDGTYMV
jgi:hypothetical protein